MAGVSRRAPSVTTPVAPRRSGPQHEDVADRAGVGLAPRLDHEHLVRERGSRWRGAARSGRALSCRLEVLPHRDVAQRVGVARPSAGRRCTGLQPAEERAADAPPLQLERQRGGGHAPRTGRAARRSGSRRGDAVGCHRALARVSGWLACGSGSQARRRVGVATRRREPEGRAGGQHPREPGGPRRGPADADRRAAPTSRTSRCPARRGSPTSARRSPTPASPPSTSPRRRALPVSSPCSPAPTWPSCGLRAERRAHLPRGHAPALRGHRRRALRRASRSWRSIAEDRAIGEPTPPTSSLVDYDPLPAVVDPEAAAADDVAAVPRRRHQRRAALRLEAARPTSATARSWSSRADREPAA